MERREAGGKPAPKPAAEVAALVRVIAEIRPDILGISEIGGPDQLADLRARLKREGLDFPHAEHLAGADPDRKLALLSRFPIVARDSEGDLRFPLGGSEFPVQRGFLDVTVEIGDGYRLRLVGVHLKSKRPVPEGEALIRRNEAHLLRKHIDGILKRSPRANLLVYGDFNDNKNEPAIREIAGKPGTASYLQDIPVADRSGDRWTHHWRSADLYSRLDYFFASPGLLPEIDRGRSGIYRSAFWSDASDHRPIVLSVIPRESRESRESSESPEKRN